MPGQSIPEHLPSRKGEVFRAQVHINKTPDGNHSLRWQFTGDTSIVHRVQQLLDQIVSDLNTAATKKPTS
jgi:hypothetical protein